MTTMTAVRASRADDRQGLAPEIVRFRAGNGAVIAVTVKAGQGRSRALELAREAIADVARSQGQDDRRGPPAQADCDEIYWSWALPDGWRR